MKIIKKDGRLEDFNISKIKTSIENAGRDSETILNESDIKILLEDIEKVLNLIKVNRDTTSSYEIIGIILDVLRKDGFNNISKAYINFEK